MLYGKRTTKRYAKRYTRNIPRSIVPNNYHSLTVGFAYQIPDANSSVNDIMDLMVTNSTDWLVLKSTYAAFKVVKVTVDYSPFLTTPVSASDAASGFVCIRDGFYSAPLTTLSTNELAKFPNVIPYSNNKSYVLSRKVASGTWFDGTATSSATSNMPKLVYYCAVYNASSTNTNKGLTRFRITLLAKGSQIDK